MPRTWAIRSSSSRLAFASSKLRWLRSRAARGALAEAAAGFPGRGADSGFQAWLGGRSFGAIAPGDMGGVPLGLLQPPGDEAGQRRPGEQHDQKAQGLQGHDERQIRMARRADDGDGIDPAWTRREV